MTITIEEQIKEFKTKTKSFNLCNVNTPLTSASTRKKNKLKKLHLWCMYIIYTMCGNFVERGPLVKLLCQNTILCLTEISAALGKEADVDLAIST